MRPDAAARWNSDTRTDDDGLMIGALRPRFLDAGAVRAVHSRGRVHRVRGVTEGSVCAKKGGRVSKYVRGVSV